MRKREARSSTERAVPRRPTVVGYSHALEQLCLLAGAAMRPEQLTSVQLDGIVRKFLRLKACLQ